MSEMYEVLKFIEHGSQCRRSLDCVRGTLLLRFLKSHPQMEKEMVIRWFRQLAVCADQYHRSGNGKSYRFINPCCIVVTQENELFLLDMESEGNAFVMKMMQSRAMREHFVRPMYERGMSAGCRADLFSYGKTIQFILAYVQICPSLKKSEELRLAVLISNCIGESRKKYDNFREVIQNLPVQLCVKKDEKLRKYLKKTMMAAVFTAGIAAGIAAENYYIQNKMIIMERNEAAVLAENMLNAYDRLIKIENSRTKMEETCVKKMELLAGLGRFEEAAEAGRAVLLELDKSEIISELIAEYSNVIKNDP